MNRQIFWIASYPKSGNTLVRSIIISLFFTKDGLFTLDKSINIKQFDNTYHIQRNKNIFYKDYNKLNFIPTLYKYMNQLQTKKALGLKEDFMFLKTHSGMFKIAENQFTYKNNTRGIIYIVRDPRDISVSWSRHSNISIQKSIDFMTNDTAVQYWMEPPKSGEIFNNKNRPRTLLSSWEKHVRSWTTLDWDIPILILRFEDLVYEKEKVIKKLINFFEKNYGFKFKKVNEKIKNILKSTDFKKLKKEEKENGFVESVNNREFFSVGKKDQWKNKLNNNQIMQIENKFYKEMKYFSYKLRVEI